MSFTRFSTEDTVIERSAIIGPLWTGALNTLTTFFTSSAQEISVNGNFYLQVYNLAFGASGSEGQFALAYGHVSGSGSAPFNTFLPGATPTRDVYGQFNSMIFSNPTSVFNFGGTNGISRDIYVLSVNRGRFKESLQPGTLNLTLSNGTFQINLTDDSNSNNNVTNFIGTTRVYNIVSGSNGISYNSSSYQTPSGSYGMFFPDYGTLILNPRALALPTGSGGLNLIPDETTSTSYTALNNTNNTALYKAITTGANFTCSSRDSLASRYVFVRVKNQQFNYTTNPSIIDSNGNLLFPVLIDNPSSYITTVGLYNDSNELLAVAKLSKPLKKMFSNEALLRVKLDF